MKSGHDQPFLRSFRLTAGSRHARAVEALLEAEGFRFEPEPFSPLCRRLTEEPFPLGSSLAAFFGWIYIQDRSSMLPPLALDPAPGSSVLDLCASPGSKTGLLAQLTGPAGFVLANEISHARLGTLRMTLRAGNVLQAGTCSHSGDRIPLRPGSWPYILLDPPCSGWGTAEKNPGVLEIWRESKLPPLIALQRRLLRRASQLLAPGGVLVYSTCTTNSEENERQVEFAEKELGLAREAVAPFPGFVWDEKEGAEGTLRVDGEKSRAQGFYVARLRRKDSPAQASAPENAPLSWRNRGCEISPARLAGPCLDPGLLPPGRAAVYAGTVRFLPAAAADMLPPDFVWQGAPLGRLAGGGFQADARLRLCLPENAGRLVLEKVSEVRSLLGGTALTCGLPGREAGLWWRDLPLGRVSLRRGRVLAAFS